MGELKKLVVKTYKGHPPDTLADFQADLAQMEAQGYIPTFQSWLPGKYAGGDVFMATLLCVILIGYFILLHMLIIKPKGTLVVYYQLCNDLLVPSNTLSIEELTDSPDLGPET